jgi:uncharacterized protein YkwD
LKPTRRTFLLATGAGALFIAGCGSLPDADATGAVMTDQAMGRINAFRRANGMPPLRTDRAASLAALEHAKRMAAARQMAHNIGPGADFGRRMKRQNVALPAAENIASGQRSLDGALEAWEVSASHRANTLDRRFSGVGVAVAYDASNGNRPYWAMVLSGG